MLKKLLIISLVVIKNTYSITRIGGYLEKKNR